jgi:UDP-4-amino-4-deoxy-L-arabinose formyltransferase/UDP-glucuronic acid dehydrogenase (UDP-4-keto-hexauronic acid decarboxylating)
VIAPLQSRAPNSGTRCLLLGYHTMGCVGLEALRRHGFEVAAVVTHRDDPNEEVWWESVAERARSGATPVHFAAKSDPKTPAFAELVGSYRPDFIFSFYFRYMLPEAVLRLARRGALNLHGSLLPRYRGRAPVNWVLVNGEPETGVSLHYMVAKPDAGDLVGQERVEIAFDDTARTLYGKLEKAAGRLLDRTLPLLKEGRAPSMPMNLAEGSYFGRRTPDDGRFAWTWPALRIYNLVRAVTHPYPGAFTIWAGRRLFVWWALPQARGVEAVPGTVVGVSPQGVEVATGDGVLLVSRCQLEGEGEMDAHVFSRAHRIASGSRLDVAGENQ